MDWMLEIPPSLFIGMVVLGDIYFIVIALVLIFARKPDVKDIGGIGGLPITLWLQLLVERFSLIPVMFIVIAGIAMILKFGFRQSSLNGLMISVSMFIVTVYIWLSYDWTSTRKKTGRILVHLTSIPNRRILLVISISLIFLGIVFFISFINFTTTLNIKASTFKEQFLHISLLSIISVAQGVFSIIFAFSHIRIHENGFQAYLDFIPWSKIESYAWVSDKNVNALKYRFKGHRLWFMRTGAIPVPASKKRQMEAILAEYLPELGKSVNLA